MRYATGAKRDDECEAMGVRIDYPGAVGGPGRPARAVQVDQRSQQPAHAGGGWEVRKLHRPWFDNWLGQVQDVDIVDAVAVLK